MNALLIPKPLNVNPSTEMWVGANRATKVLLSGWRSTPFFRGKGRLFQWIVSSFFKGALEVENGQGVRLRINTADYIGRTIAHEGAFEPKSLALASAIMSRNGGVFLDVGCNVGLYTLVLGRLPHVECIAIDGSFVALAKFHENLQLNPGVKVRIISTALCDEHRLLCFEVPSDGNLGGTHIASGERPAEAMHHFWATGTMLERVLAQLEPRSIQLLKIDVEGSELAVFQGLDFDGPYRPENLIVECYTKLFPQSAACFEYLLAQGYRAMTVDGKPINRCGDLPEQNVWFESTRSVQIVY